MSRPTVLRLALLGLVFGASTVRAVGATAGSGSGGPTDTAARRHAGIVVSVDPATRRFVLEEMSPGRQVRRIVVRVEPGGSLVEIAREPEEVVLERTPEAVEIAESHRYVERPLDLARVQPGDFVVVVLDKQPAGNQSVPARRVEVTARAGEVSSSGSPRSR